jgi:hypothetical protein
MHLLRTQDAVAEFAANQAYQGDHYSYGTAFGERGTVVGSEEFDFVRDEVQDEDLFAPEQWMTGIPMAEEVIPDRQLHLNLVMHRDPEESHDRPEIANSRRYLIARMYSSLKESLMAEDDVRLYMVGSRDEKLLDRDARHLEGTRDPKKAAAAVASISLSGLTIVVSTLKNLPLDRAVGDRKLPIAALKANHAFDLRLGSNMGDWDTGDPDFGTIDTNDFLGRPRKQLVRFREKQAREDQVLEARFKAAGIHLGRVIFDKEKYPDHYMDFAAADGSLAAAIKPLGRR